MLKLIVKSFWKALCRRVLLRSSVGFTLVEVVVAILLLAIVVGGVLMAMTVVFNMQAHQDQQRIAEYLAENEFEYINTQPYIWGNLTGSTSQYPPQYAKVRSTQTSTKDYYSLIVTAVPIGNSSNPTPYQPLPIQEYTYFDAQGNKHQVPYVNDEGIQEITIYVYAGSQSSTVLVTTNYKVHKFAGN